MTTRPAPTGAGKSAPISRGPDSSGVLLCHHGKSANPTPPRHLAHWIQAKKSREPGQRVIPVKIVAVHDDAASSWKEGTWRSRARVRDSLSLPRRTGVLIMAEFAKLRAAAAELDWTAPPSKGAAPTHPNPERWECDCEAVGRRQNLEQTRPGVLRPLLATGFAGTRRRLHRAHRLRGLQCCEGRRADRLPLVGERWIRPENYVQVP